ncbi:MAG: isoleucine--tRNA ligase [Candidatus Diapherotrites archaeon]|nr:isoleucine--tRNA ligase [Candidatus Diapherotrites archaeon]
MPLKDFGREEEELIKDFWLAKEIPKKSRQLNSKAKKKFYLMDGPPYATGHIHLGTALNKVLKDVAMRSKRMHGYKVFDRPGYDTHGLPIEHKVEKKLGFSNKGDIERFGIANFVEECKKFATEFIDTMNSEFMDLGVWMDWENPYLTLDAQYIEAIWWAFKNAEKKKMLYLGYYPIHVCPRCATPLAYYEINYTKLTDESIYVKFPVVGKEKTYLIIWTTTPWTLPGNTGVMVHPDFDYAFATLSNGEVWIIAKELIHGIMEKLEYAYTIEKVVKGKELEGMHYTNPLAKNLKIDSGLNGAYRVVTSSRYVTLDFGTGLVHCAPGHGKEDYEAGRKACLPLLCPVGIDGTMLEEAGKYAGKKAREVDQEIIDDLESSGFIVYKHSYTHDYPICWRCSTPLIMLSTPQWFLNVSKIQKKLIAANKKVRWVPEWVGARMQNWLESLSDWPISRMRYWGTPVPIWSCKKCNSYHVFGTLEELKKASGVKKLPEPHRPYIDEIRLKCKCGGEMVRIPEVLDVWFDSGVSSWAALGFPKEKKLFKSFWPADLNLEGTDQIRGWWNSQLIAGLICFGKSPYKAVSVHGMVLDIDKRKMSKSIGNVVMPSDVIKEYSRDYLRYYLVKNSRGTDMLFSWDEFKDIRRFFNTFTNSTNYYLMYLKDATATKKNGKDLRTEDLWILSRYNSIISEATQAYANYEFWRVLMLVEYFVIEDFSRNYIKLIRDRVDEDKAILCKIFSEILLGIAKLLAPIVPHFSEYIYRELRAKNMPESIHFCSMPMSKKAKINKKLEKDFASALEIIQAVLLLREKNHLRRRWTLRSIVVQPKAKFKVSKVAQILKIGCNVLEVLENFPKDSSLVCTETENFKVCIDTFAEQWLKDEWEFRELVRRIQAERKVKGLMPKQKASLILECNDVVFLEKFVKRIEKETNTKINKSGVIKKEFEKIIQREFRFEITKTK